MAEYVYINEYSSRGKLAISARVYDGLVDKALKSLDITTTLKKNKEARLTKPVYTTIKNGIIHVWLCVDVTRGTNIQELSKKIEDEIAGQFKAYTDQVPFDVNVKTNSIV
ncbi:MAG: hypothetical protein LUC16_03725 [Coprobacillus sp.]|nr:hypothetical protein [Coprobacillus sp.]